MTRSSQVIYTTDTTNIYTKIILNYSGRPAVAVLDSREDKTKRHREEKIDRILSPLYSLLLACLLSRFSLIRLFAIPWTVTHQAPLSMGILQARILEWVALPFSKDLPYPGIELGFPELHVNSLPCESPGKSVQKKYTHLMILVILPFTDPF